MAIAGDKPRGLAEGDPRNAGPIAHFRPKDVTLESMRASMRSVMPHASAEDVEARAREAIARIAAKPVRPPPPLSQPLDAAKNPFYELSTHPDIVSALWKLDVSLPQRCRWVLWGKPSLVHPETGVVFAVAFGTIGIVMRLPPDVLALAPLEQAAVSIKGNPGQTFDIGPAGPEWRFVRGHFPQAAWCLAAYNFAGQPL